MTVSNTLTWDQNPPIRPGLPDITGGTKTNRPGKVPDPTTQPCAEEDNQRAAQIAGIARVVPMARVCVTISGGVPTITSVQAPGTNVAAGSFIVTDNGAGDTTVSWVATVLPAVAGFPAVSQGDDTAIDRIRAFYTTLGGNQAVRIKSFLGATPTDCSYAVDIY
jgi:hypothetical protein